MEVEEEESWREQPLGPLLEHLWAFRCDLTMGRNVSSMTWNKRNPVRSVFQHTFVCFICYIIIIDIFAKLMLGQYHLQFTKKISLKLCIAYRIFLLWDMDSLITHMRNLDLCAAGL